MYSFNQVERQSLNFEVDEQHEWLLILFLFLLFAQCLFLFFSPDGGQSRRKWFYHKLQHILFLMLLSGDGVYTVILTNKIRLFLSIDA